MMVSIETLKEEQRILSDQIDKTEKEQSRDEARGVVNITICKRLTELYRSLIHVNCEIKKANGG